MAVVELKINGRIYKLSCAEDEKDNLEKIGDQLNHMATDLVANTGVTNESLLLLMLAVISKNELNQSKNSISENDEVISQIYKRIKELNRKLNNI